MDNTLGMLIERVRRDNSLSTRGPVFTLASTHTAGGTTVEVNETPEHGGPGSVLSMGVSSYYVQSVDSVAKAFTVIPGYHGTTDETHDPPMIVSLDDPFPGGALKDHAAKEILGWRKRLWRVETVDIDVTNASLTYEFVPPTEPVLMILDVRRAPSAGSFGNFMWNDDRWPHVPYRLLRNADPTEFPSGFALQLKGRPPDTTLRVAYATTFDLDPFDWDTDLVDDVGLDESWIEIVELGMAARAASGAVKSRSDWRTGGHVRVAEEVTVLDMIRVAQDSRAEHDMKLAEAAIALRGQWPYRSA
jgi:hypothetical protein